MKISLAHSLAHFSSANVSVLLKAAENRINYEKENERKKVYFHAWIIYHTCVFRNEQNHCRENSTRESESAQKIYLRITEFKKSLFALRPARRREEKWRQINFFFPLVSSLLHLPCELRESTHNAIHHTKIISSFHRNALCLSSSFLPFISPNFSNNNGVMRWRENEIEQSRCRRRRRMLS